MTNINLLKTIWEAIKSADHIFLYHHVDPDGDCLGAKYGLGELIKKNLPQKSVFYIGNTYQLFNFLPMPEDRWDQIDVGCFKNSLAIVLDGDNRSRVLESNDLLTKPFTKKMRIDHHDSIADLEYDYFWVDDQFAAAAEQVGYLARKLNLDLDSSIASYIYLGINTDTDRLSFDRVQPRTFRTLAYLIDHGLNLVQVNQQLTQRTENWTRFISYVWSNYILAGDFIYCIIKQELIQKYQLNHLQANDANILANIRNTKAWAFFIELPNGNYRVRLRSNGLDLTSFLKPFGWVGSYKSSVALHFPKEKLTPIIEHITKLTNENQHS